MTSFSGLCHGQQENLINPSALFKIKAAKVLVVGTFHFEYPNLDAVKTDSLDQIDILSNQKQAELKELIEYIKLFKPNKIGVESFGNPNCTERLRSFRNGNYTLTRDERDQLGVRIAHELNLDTIYALDAYPIYSELNNVIPDFIDSLSTDFDYAHAEIDSIYKDFFSYDGALEKSIELLDYFMYMNSKAYHKYMKGYYYLGDFKNSKYSGADMTTIHYFSRNLRILRRIQDIVENENDRILVIFGNSHASALRDFITDCPTLDYIEFSELSNIEDR